MYTYYLYLMYVQQKLVCKIKAINQELYKAV